MTQPQPSVARQQAGSPPSTTPSERYLDPGQVVAGLEVSSRKGLFEAFSELIAKKFVSDGEAPEQDNDPDEEDELPTSSAIFETLHDRERLGCTALGKGIALPHGRIASITEPVIAIARLASPISYDAPDGIKIWFAVCLLVPTEANDVHLQLLARLASRFSDEEFLNSIRSAATDSDLYQLFSDF